MNKIDKLAINSKQETICIISTYPSPNPSVPQNIAWQYNVTNLTQLEIPKIVVVLRA